MTDYLTLAQVAKLCPNKPSPHSIWRWARKGIRGRNGETIRLRHVRIGGKLHVPREAVEEFFEATAAADAQHFATENSPRASSAKPRSKSDRDQAIDAAEAELEAAGA